VPIGLVGRFVWGSAARAALAGAALTIFIETCQYGIVGRAGSFTDMRNNTAGAVLGALIAAGAAHVLTRTARRPGRHTPR
jgi:VanZ family protein